MKPPRRGCSQPVLDEHDATIHTHSDHTTPHQKPCQQHKLKLIMEVHLEGLNYSTLKQRMGRRLNLWVQKRWWPNHRLWTLLRRCTQREFDHNRCNDWKVCQDSQEGLDTISTRGQSSCVNPRTYGAYTHMYRQKELWKMVCGRRQHRICGIGGHGTLQENCLICADAPGALSIVVPERHTFRNCAAVQQRECREGRFTSQKDK